MSKTMLHMCIDIEGALMNANNFVGNITIDGKTLFSVKEIKDFFQSQLDLGRKVLPIGDCDNFDYQTGCKGHEVQEGEE